MILTANLLAEDSGIQGIDSINSDPKNNFLSKIIDNDNDDDFLFNNPDFSPYSEIDFNCASVHTLEPIIFATVIHLTISPLYP